MLLYVTGPREADEAGALAFYSALPDAWRALVRARMHPRTGSELEAAVTRLDLFLAAFSPAPAPAPHGLRISEPPPPQAMMWGLGLRSALRELVVSTFSPSGRFGVALDPIGPRTSDPNPGDLPPLADLAASLPGAGDPAQRPGDPRLWLVVAPPLPEALENMFLPTFLRAEPYARLAAAPGPHTGAALARWLEQEADKLLAGTDLARRGLVTRYDDPRASFTQEYKDQAGRTVVACTMHETATGLEEMYAWRCVIEAGHAYARLHSHSGSEELYLVLEGEGLLRVNERVLSLKAGDCFGKPRNYDCATQIVNPGPGRLVLLDAGTMRRSEVDLCRYPEHGEMFVRFGGHRWVMPIETIRPGMEMFRVYDRRYVRAAAPAPAAPTGVRPA